MRLLFPLIALSAFTAAASMDELTLAREALRDGLGQVARTHAEKVVADSDAAKLVILESFAAEGRWDEVSTAIDRWPKASGAAFDYYRSAAKGDRLQAIAALKAGGDSVAIADALALEASIYAKDGRIEEAKKVWRGIAAMTNAGERALVNAAVNLGEVGLLRKVVDEASLPPIRKFAELHLGRALLKAAESRAEGTEIIRRLVKEAPDVKGAKDAFLAMVEADFTFKDWRQTEKDAREAMEIWVDVAKNARVQELLGMSQFELGRFVEARVTLLLAGSLTTDRRIKADVALKAADALAFSGHAEEATADYRRVLADYPEAQFAKDLARRLKIKDLERKGCELYRNCDYLGAQTNFEQVAAMDSNRKPQMEHFRMLCLYGRGLDDEAIEFSRQLASASDDQSVRLDATLWLAKALFNRGDWKESGERFDEYVAGAEERPDIVQAMLWRSRAAFANRDFELAVRSLSALISRYPSFDEARLALLLQSEALIELSRYDEAILVLDQFGGNPHASDAERVKARVLRADALFATGADDASRYSRALEEYRAVRDLGSLDYGDKLILSYKIARTLEKLRRFDEAEDQYYSNVVNAYRDARSKGDQFDDEATAAFVRAAFHLADDYEGRGKVLQAVNVLELAATSGVPASEEAKKRIQRIKKQGKER